MINHVHINMSNNTHFNATDKNNTLEWLTVLVSYNNLPQSTDIPSSRKKFTYIVWPEYKCVQQPPD